MELLEPKLDYVTLKSSTKKEEARGIIVKLFQSLGLDEEECENDIIGKKEVFFFRDRGIDFKIYQYHIEVEFHSTFFASNFEPLRIIQGLCKAGLNYNLLLRPIRVDIARDVLDYNLNDFYEVCTNLDKFKFNFKALTWIREVKSRDVESIYLKGGKSRWSLCIYNKSKEIKDNWHKMTESKRDYYKYYLNRKVIRFELRVRSEFLKSRTFFDFFYEEEETNLCIKILANWSKRRSIFINDENNKKLEIFEKVFKYEKSSKGYYTMLLSPIPHYKSKDKLQRKIFTLIKNSEFYGRLTARDINEYAEEESKVITMRDQRYWSSCKLLRKLINDSPGCLYSELEDYSEKAEGRSPESVSR